MVQIYEDYIKLPLHYPKIANRIKSHRELYSECGCSFWLPDGKRLSDKKAIMQLSVNNNGEYVKRFVNANATHSKCSNCLTYVDGNNIHSENDLMKEIFIFEYASYLLNLNHDLDVLALCNCCYGEFKQDFIKSV